MKKDKIGIVLIVFGIVAILIGGLIGAVFLAVSGFSDKSIAKKEKEYESIKREYVETKGFVSEVYDGETVVLFEDDNGYEYELELSMSSSSYSEGTLVTVYYDEDNPEDAIAPDMEKGILTALSNIFKIVGYVIIGIASVPGLIFIIVGAVLHKKTELI